ncbi:baculoviral IAP repeat-containing protein 6-like isoform X2 [Lineus longissimus]|uniref:baculoviral IAP repeat-containing protein 6-like isoform X2 n=1 Tax=Lineus longissimus TaxID=88925 RepID=UPI00315D988A
MAGSAEWFIAEDGCLSIGESATGVTYHSTLNNVIVTTKEPAVKVIDVTSGSVLQKSDVSACPTENLRCTYLPGRDKVFFTDGVAVGVRRDLNGVLLLDTMLQTPVKKAEDLVRVELPLQDASHLFKLLMSVDLPGVDFVEDVLKELEKQTAAIQEATKGNHKTAKWATVCMKLPHCTLKSVFSNLMVELKQHHIPTPALPVAAAIYDRLSYLLPGTRPDLSDVGSGPVDRTLMYSEAARRETFTKWPHMNYKWALPDPMAQAGFYHQPNATGDDRAMCFTCNVCLVCWEPTDEPWSEHERHSPSCPFVKGEYTQNVPLALTYATEPASLHGKKSEKVEAVSTTSCDDYICTSTLNGGVVVWDVARQIKKHAVFYIDPCDPLIALKTGTQLAQFDDTQLIKKNVKNAWQEDSDSKSGNTSEDYASSGATDEESQSKSVSDPPMLEIPLHNGDINKSCKLTGPVKRSRPSCDIQVSSMCAAGPPQNTASAAPEKPIPSLVSGVSIRRTPLLLNWGYRCTESKEVQLMNQVNEAISTDSSMEIIPSESSHSHNSHSDLEHNPFIPYILVHDISQKVAKEQKLKETEKKITKEQTILPLQDYIQMVEMDYDSDVEIVAVTPPPGSNGNKMTLDGTTSSIKVETTPKMELSVKETKTNIDSDNLQTRVSPGRNRLVQCIEVPEPYRKEEYVVSSVTPTIDKNHLLVVISPKFDSEIEEDEPVQLNSNDKADLDLENSPLIDGEKLSNGVLGSEGSLQSDESKNDAANEAVSGGCLLLYKVKYDKDIVTISEEPCRHFSVENLDDAVISTYMLPIDLIGSPEEEEIMTDSLNQCDGSGKFDSGVPGFVAVITQGGRLMMFRLDDFHLMGTVDRLKIGEKFTSATYCTGMDRLCASTSAGKLHFYQLCPGGPDFTETDILEHSSPIKPCSVQNSTDFCESDTGPELPPKVGAGELLVKQPLTVEVLSSLHELIQFENLLPKFSATVPQCWAEIQQEQQQRRHPQHLQQQGEATQHTRTWRLQRDSTSRDEHLFELVLPKSTCVGHIDLKFNLRPLCNRPPKIQVTLLKQNISSFGRADTIIENVEKKNGVAEVPPNVVEMEEVEKEKEKEPLPSTSNSPSPVPNNNKKDKINGVTDPEFLLKHNAEILCGPVDLSNYVDLSGHSGMVTLTSSALMKVKTRSFLLHIKALPSPKDDEQKPKDNKRKAASPADQPPKTTMKKKSISMFEQLYFPGTNTSTPPAPKDRMENMKGCDCIQEISVTIRKAKKTYKPRDRLQRCMMLESASFHDQLLLAICGDDEKTPITTSIEHKQNLALDIACWVASIQVNEPGLGFQDICIVRTVQANLEALVKTCFIDGSRTMGHKCARLVALCLEFTKGLSDPDAAPSFSFTLLQALIECLPLIPRAISAGALHWYFSLLNRVKCMDINLVGQRCSDMLSLVAKHYSDKINPIYNLLKARYALYGSPEDPDLFDIEPPHNIKPSSTVTNSSTYASVVAGVSNSNPTFGSGGTNTTSNGTSSNTGKEESDFEDLLTLTAGFEKSQRSGNDQFMRQMVGLLEVEPLHFTCHATSDGTRMERMDSGVPGTTVTSTHSGLSGTINFGEGLASSLSAGAALASLSTAMASAEQQLQLLQSKQQQLMKLQVQKNKLEQQLAETTNTISAPTPHLAFSYSSELFPPTPKTTPLFMTPPMTPPNEGMQSGSDTRQSTPKVASKDGKSGHPPVAISIPQSQHLLQPPPGHVLVIERMHSGARRFVVLDFGKPILLTDVFIPLCFDLASISIDVWIHGEEIDGRRLVVASDIGLHSLVMNDLMPPPVCRYLKITTVGRYGNSTTRSRIPIGSFFGHTFILPWEFDDGMLGFQNGDEANLQHLVQSNQSAIMSQLGMLLALQEDIQCRYSLARHRLENLLSGLDQCPANSSYYQSSFKKGTSDLDQKVIQAYNDCIQLQHQLNLARSAVDRLQRSLGIQTQNMDGQSNNACAVLKQTSTDKLRVLSEFLLETLLSMTNPSPSIPALPSCLYMAFDPTMCEALFRNLCIHGNRRVQVMAGVLLVRICGSQTWWGDFLGTALRELFSSHQTQVIAQDRVFVLLTMLGQKSLTSGNASQVLESLLGLLARLLSPLVNQQDGAVGHMVSLDLVLISRLLVFLSKTMDNSFSAGSSSDDGDKRDKDKDNNNGSMGTSNRWDFIQGDAAMHSTKGSSNSRSKLYRRKLHKRLMHHKQQLLDLQQAKKNFLSSQMEKLGSGITKEAEAIIKHQEQLFKKTLKQYTSKHFKDIMHIRRTDAEILKKLPKDPNGNSSDRELVDTDNDNSIVLPRERCVPVVRGLVALLLTMDFTCNTDLFLITCKVLARIISSTRPAVMLSEAMSQDQLEKFVLLCSNIEHSQSSTTWGGPWAVHAVTCLLQDVLESERMYPMTNGGDLVTDDDDIATSMSETDDTLCQNGTLPSLDESQVSAEDSLAEGKSAIALCLKISEEENGVSCASKDETLKFDKDSSMLVDMILDDEDDEPPPLPLPSIVTESKNGGEETYQIISVQPPSATSSFFGSVTQPQKLKLEKWKSKFNDVVSKNGTAPVTGMSVAMDNRLEFGIEMSAELRLRVMVSVEAENVQRAIFAALPPIPAGGASFGHSYQMAATDDEQMSEAMMYGNPAQQPLVPSWEMLSTCFNHLFTQLPLYRIDLDTILHLWLIMNEDSSSDDTHIGFDPTKVPTIPLSHASMDSLLHVLVVTPNISVSTWVLVFQSLTWLANLKADDKFLASAIVADCNLVPVLIKFLSSSQYVQVGPTATRAFNEFLMRLQVRCADDNENHLKELLLKLVYTLTVERGPFHCGLGPLDAQCKLLEHILDQNYDTVDINNAISVISAISTLTHQHILSQDRVSCKSSLESCVSARSCFGGLFATMLCPGDSKTMVGECNRDVLVSSLLKLVNMLVQSRIPSRASPRRQYSGSVNHISGGSADFAMTDAGKMSMAEGMVLGMTDAARSEEETMSKTDEQKTETAASQRRYKHCSHYQNVEEPRGTVKEPCVADIILAHEQIMWNLINSLSRCNSNTTASIVSSSQFNNTQDNISDLEPISVGDCIFQILCTMNKKTTDLKLVIKPLFAFLSSSYQSAQLHNPCHLSEPLLWIFVGVLDCKHSLGTFIEMGGIQVICRNLVWSSKQMISTNPSFISAIMPFMGSGKTITGKRLSQEADNLEGLQNFAPLGCVSSSSPTAGPGDVLIQASPPHRRARSAAWSYHFYPDEAWIDLTIQLPCSILLKEVHIQPHLSSLATCPSVVSLEISRDGVSSIPVCPPVTTTGLMIIKLSLHKAEVANSVTLRLHKPRDSNTMGLSQILVMGYTAFGEGGSKGALASSPEEQVTRTSMCWMRLLHHCMTSVDGMGDQVAEAASPTPSLLNTCSALLVSPITNAFLSNLEAAMLKLGLHSTEMGLALIDNLLRNPPAEPVSANLPLYGKTNGVANEATVDILYQLGMTQDAGTHTRVMCLAQWLGDNARVALQKNGVYSDDHYRPSPRQTFAMDEGLPNPAPAHVHCIAAILWQSSELQITYSLHNIITRDLFSSVYEWSTVLLHNSPLKKAVDTVICAMCHIQPDYFRCLLEWMGIIMPAGSGAAANIPDDSKEPLQNQSMTDDSKEANSAFSPGPDSPPMQEVGPIILDEQHLSTLSIACQSDTAISQLLDSGFPAMLSQGLFEFCNKQIWYSGDGDGVADAAKPGPSSQGGRRRFSSESMDNKGLVITADLIAPVLSFLSEVSKEAVMKEWLGGIEGSIFWPVLLSLLCSNNVHHPTHAAQQRQQKLMTSQQRAMVETATVAFFTRVVAGHSANQLLFAQVLCDVIRNQGVTQQGIVYSNLPLSGFTRRLFLQVLLEDEKILVAFKSSSQLHKGHLGATSSQIYHPKFGAGHRCKIVSVGLQTTCGEVLRMVSDSPSLTLQLVDKPAEASHEEGKKDTGQLGIEVVNQISWVAGGHETEVEDGPPEMTASLPPNFTIGGAGVLLNSGALAKEKRDKMKSLPPRPPTRRGRHSVKDDPSFSSTMVVPVLSMYHTLMPKQPLPPDLTLAQVLVMLHQRGLLQGQPSLEFTVKLGTKRVSTLKNISQVKVEKEYSPCDNDTKLIPEQVLLETQSLPSPLQVFASQGGLALLAEHLPLLYPEITRQDIFEPMPSGSNNQSSKQPSPSLPTIPPHSLVAFGLFLRLPGYAEVLLKERKKAQCLLRLVLGVTDDGDGGHILTSPLASSLPTLPFYVLKTLFDQSPLTTDDGLVLRKMTLDIGALHLILACLSVLSHHAPRVPIPGFHHELIMVATQATSNPPPPEKPAEEKTQHYWAKGTGFGTGSFTSSWDAEQALLRQKSEEEHVTCLLQVLASYINPGGHIAPHHYSGDDDEQEYEGADHNENHCLPTILPDLLTQSCLVPAISSYLRNDSVLDMARHVPLYKSLLELLRALGVCPVLVPLLLPLDKEDGDSSSITSLLAKMKGCVDTYASRLKTNNKSSMSKATQTKEEDDESEGLALLIPDIQRTAAVVIKASDRVKQIDNAEGDTESEKRFDRGAESSDFTLAERYMEIMREEQFDTFEIVQEDEGIIRFTMSHHYESNIKTAGDINNPARARRLAQEAVTLSTSLPLSASSSVFVRCDEDRLDVMKVLITGPSETPYANGCFEFDVYFPPDYPNAPPLVNLETTGNHTVRFNPNLYNDGKVCLSILNTWHGRPEEKWNSQTSSFLQVLVSIQSLILVSEPYFNEPGYERSRGTPSGTASSREYDSNIRQASVKWAMLEQFRNPSPCFRDVIQKHFWLKRHEIIRQIEEWISDLEQHSSDKRFGRTISHNCLALKRHYNQLKEEFAKMKPALMDNNHRCMSDDEVEGGGTKPSPNGQSDSSAFSCDTKEDNANEVAMDDNSNHSASLDNNLPQVGDCDDVLSESAVGTDFLPSSSGEGNAGFDSLPPPEDPAYLMAAGGQGLNFDMDLGPPTPDVLVEPLLFPKYDDKYDDDVELPQPVSLDQLLEAASLNDNSNPGYDEVDA